MKITHLLVLLGCTLISTACSEKPASDQAETVGSSAVVTFKGFEYEGFDEVYTQPLNEGEYFNPIISGFYPDPSIVRGEDAFYMVHSSFSYFPGIPLMRSTDLVNWQPIGHVLTRPSQLNVGRAGVSRGIFAPTIRYHKGVYYVITTGVDDAGGNFIVTTTDPMGEWSDPYYLPEIDGIDPSIFFDDDGKVYITHNGPPIGEPLYQGHRAIWQWEFDLLSMTVVAGSGKVIVNGGVDISQEPIWIEGPHLYKINDWYYLLCAEGGTAEDHSEVVFRSRSLDEPFVPYGNNPILTQRHLDPARANPIATAGHADMVQTSNGEWWAVFLATRNYQQDFFNTGRETFLMPVAWVDEWPVFPDGTKPLPFRHTAPFGLPATEGAQPLSGNFKMVEAFKGPALDWQWNTLRSGNSDWYSFAAEGGLQVQPKSVAFTEFDQPAFVGRRQQHQNFSASTRVQWPLPNGTLGGITAFQSEQAHVLLAIEATGDQPRITVTQVGKDGSVTLAEVPLPSVQANSISLTINGDDQAYRFAYQIEGAEIQHLDVSTDARELSTQRAGGFVGVYLGVYAQRP